jgi:hypothetical protein
MVVAIAKFQPFPLPVQRVHYWPQIPKETSVVDRYIQPASHVTGQMQVCMDLPQNDVVTMVESLVHRDKVFAMVRAFILDSHISFMPSALNGERRITLTSDEMPLHLGIEESGAVTLANARIDPFEGVTRYRSADPIRARMAEGVLQRVLNSLRYRTDSVGKETYQLTRSMRGRLGDVWYNPDLDILELSAMYDDIRGILCADTLTDDQRLELLYALDSRIPPSFPCL